MIIDNFMCPGVRYIRIRSVVNRTSWTSAIYQRQSSVQRVHTLHQPYPPRQNSSDLQSSIHSGTIVDCDSFNVKCYYIGFMTSDEVRKCEQFSDMSATVDSCCVSRLNNGNGFY